MANQIESKYWLEKQWQHIERDWDKRENIVQIIFVIAGIIFPLSLSFSINQGQKLNPLLGILTSLSFWTIVVTSILLIRNSGKATKQRLDNIDKNIEDLKSSISNLVIEIQRDRNERNKLK